MTPRNIMDEWVINRGRIAKLRFKAIAAGDFRMALICTTALGGGLNASESERDAAWDECIRVLDAAESAHEASEETP